MNQDDECSLSLSLSFLSLFLSLFLTFSSFLLLFSPFAEVVDVRSMQSGPREGKKRPNRTEISNNT